MASMTVLPAVAAAAAAAAAAARGRTERVGPERRSARPAFYSSAVSPKTQQSALRCLGPEYVEFALVGAQEYRVPKVNPPSACPCAQPP